MPVDPLPVPAVHAQGRSQCELSPYVLAAFPHDDLMPTLGQQPSQFEPGRAGTDHQRALRIRRGGEQAKMLAAGVGVRRAGELEPFNDPAVYAVVHAP